MKITKFRQLQEWITEKEAIRPERFCLISMPKSAIPSGYPEVYFKLHKCLPVNICVCCN